MSVDIGPALGLTADSKSLEVATGDLKDLSKAAHQAEGAADSLTGGTRRMSQGMMQALASLKSMDTSLLKLTQSQRQNNDETQEAARRAATLTAQYTTLRGSLDPLYATSKRYESALETLNAAQAAGVISDAERTRTLGILDAQFEMASMANKKLAGSTAYTSNVFAQFNDIGMMAFSGQSPMMLAIQQGTSLSQVFAEIQRSGGGASAIFSTMRGALMSMISPTSLITLGLIAGGAALLQWGMSALGASSDTKSFKDAVKDAETAIAAIHEASLALSAGGLEDLRAKYGMVTAEVRQLVEQERLLALADGSKKVNEALAALTDKLGDGVFATAYGDLEGIFNVTANSAQTLYGVLQDISKQDTLAKQLASIVAMKGRLSEATNGFTVMSDKQRGMLEGLTKAESLVRQQQQAIAQTPAYIDASTNATARWASAMSSVHSYLNAIAATMASLGAGGISLAAIKTETELLKQGKSLRDASFGAAKQTAELEGAKRTKELKAQYGIVGEWLGKAEANQKTAIVDAQMKLDIERESAREREKAANSSGGGKGAAEVKAAQKGFQTIRELLEEESLFQFAEYDKRQQQLDAAHAKRLVSEETYQMMSAQLRTKYYGSEWEQRALQTQMDQDALKAALDQKLLTEAEYYQKRKELQWANLLSEENRSDFASDLSNTSQYFSQLYSMTGSSFDALLKLQQGFSAAAALMNAWKAYTDVLADPTVPFWGKVAAAGSVLAAGLGAVNAIKGASKGSSGGGGSSSSTGRSTSTSTAAATAPETPIRATLDAIDPSALYSGAAIQKMFEAIQKEAGNRGIIWVADGMSA